MTRRTRVRILLGFTGALLMLVIGALVLVNTGWFREWLRVQVVTRGTAAINGEVVLGSVEGSFFRNVRLNGLSIRQAGQPVIEAEAIEAHYDAWQLITGHLVVDRLTLTRPTVHLTRDAEGWNLARLIRTSDTGPAAAPRAVRVSRIDIIGGQLVAVMDGEQVASVSSLSLDASLDVDAGQTKLNVTRAALIDDRSGVSVTALEAAITFDDQGLVIDGIRLDAPSVQVAGRLSVPDAPGAMIMDIRATLRDWQARRYAAYIPEAQQDLPPVSGDITARGPLSALQATWNLILAGSASTGDVLVDLVAPQPALKGRITARNINPKVLVRREDLDGTITAVLDLDATFDADDPLRSRAAFNISGGPLSMAGYVAQGVAAKGTLAGGTLQAAGRVQAYGATTTTDVHVTNLGADRGSDVTASGRITRLNVASLPQRLKLPEMATAISGRYVVSLSDDYWKVDFDAEESSIQDATLAAGSIIRAEAHGSMLDASIAADVANVSATLVGEQTERPTTVGGRIEASVSIPDLREPFTLESLGTVRGHVLANLSESVVMGTDVVGASVDASLDAGQLTIRQLEVESPAVALSAQGGVAVGTNAAVPSDLKYKVDIADMSALPAEWVTGLRGGLRLTGALGGSAQRPTSVGEFTLSEPGYKETGEALAVKGTFDVVLPDRDFEKLAATAEAEATFLTIGGREIQTLAFKSKYEAQRVELTARIDQRTRSIEVDGVLALFPDYQEVHLRNLTLSGLGDPWRLAEGGDTVVRYGADDVQVKGLTFVRGPERINIAGTVALPDRGDHSDVTVELEGISVGDLLTLTTGKPSVTGVASGRAHLTGAISAPVVEASLEVLEGTAAAVPFTRAGVDVKLEERRAAVKGRVDEPNGSALTIDGVVPFGEEDGALDLRVVSSGISLGLAAAFTTHVEAVQGVANLDMHVGGTFAAPALTGTVGLVDAAFTVAPTGVRYQNVLFDVRLAGETLSIERASLADEDGHVMTLTGTGHVLGNAERTIDVQVKSQGIHVLGNELGEVDLTIDARAQGSLLSPNITGRIVVDRGRLEVDELLERFAAPGAAIVPPPTTPGPAAPGTPTTPAPPAETTITQVDATEAPDGDDVTLAETQASNSTIEIEVEMPDNVVLRGRDIRTAAGSLGLGNLNMTVGGGFAVRKESGVPVRLVGAVEVIRGFYEFQGRRFEVEQGSEIRFRGPESSNPELDVTGQREVSGITARVEVTGTARRPRIALSSQPPLDEGDVLSLIIFNQPMSQLGQSEQVDLMDRAGDMALGALATTLADSIGRALDVDLFEIRAPSSGGAGEVALGTQVSDRLFVGFRQEFGADSASRLSFEYRLTELLRLLTSVGQGADRSRATRDREAAGVDLVFRVRY